MGFFGTEKGPSSYSTLKQIQKIETHKKMGWHPLGQIRIQCWKSKTQFRTRHRCARPRFQAGITPWRALWLLCPGHKSTWHWTRGLETSLHQCAIIQRIQWQACFLIVWYVSFEYHVNIRGRTTNNHLFVLIFDWDFWGCLKNRWNPNIPCHNSLEVEGWMMLDHWSSQSALPLSSACWWLHTGLVE